jgi:hypothetical protein
LDDVLVGTIDLYASDTQPAQIVWASTRLTSEPHVLEIRAKGTKNPAASGHQVSIDGLLVLR